MGEWIFGANFELEGRFIGRQELGPMKKLFRMLVMF